MELDELIQRIQNLERVQALADKPEPEPGFTMQELKADNEFLRNLLKEKEDKLVDIQQRLDLVLQQQNNSYKQIESLISTITQLHLTISRLERKNQDLLSDGYNAYMYLDDELIDIEHLCCLAHARSKFWYAYEQGSELARFFLEKIGALYGKEAAVCLPQ